jgi:hypothetical protein
MGKIGPFGKSRKVFLAHQKWAERFFRGCLSVFTAEGRKSKNQKSTLLFQFFFKKFAENSLIRRFSCWICVCVQKFEIQLLQGFRNPMEQERTSIADVSSFLPSALSRALDDVIATPSRALERAQKQSDPHRAPSVLCVHRPSLLSELMRATTGTRSRAVLEERTLDFEICTCEF